MTDNKPFQTEYMIIDGFDNQPEPDPPVPLYKKVLCGNNPLGDFHHMFWGKLTCMCCGFYRGMLLGIIYASSVYGLFECFIR